MSANRLIAHQRITAALASLFNTVPAMQPILGAIVVDDVDKEDDTGEWATETLALKDNTLLTFDRKWVACQEDSHIRYGLYHLALGVQFDIRGRGEGRDSRVWATAGAYVCNAVIQSQIAAGQFPADYLVAPPGTLLNDRHVNAKTTTEEVYELLMWNRDWFFYG